jgi:hypothetical protein
MSETPFIITKGFNPGTYVVADRERTRLVGYVSKSFYADGPSLFEWLA